MTARTAMPDEARTNGGKSWKGGRTRRLQTLLNPVDALWMIGWLKARKMSWGDYLTREIQKLRAKQ